jgi:hypothetical protein
MESSWRIVKFVSSLYHRSHTHATVKSNCKTKAKLLHLMGVV